MGKGEKEPLMEGDKPKDKAKDKGAQKDGPPQLDCNQYMATSRKVKKDTLDATIVACVRLENSLGMDIHTRTGFACIVMVQLCTLMVQTIIAILFDVVVATPVMAKYAPAAVNMVISAVNTAMSTTPPGGIGLNQRTCITQRAHPWLGYMMMFMWFGLMVDLIISTCEKVSMLIQFPLSKGEVPKINDPNKEKEEKVKLDYDYQSYDKMGKSPDKINHMAFKWKLFVLLFTMLPHLMLYFYMTYVGMKFLAATGDPGRLILKAMALKFVLGLDKIFYMAFASEQLATYIKKCKYDFIRPTTPNYFNTWISTLFKIFLVICLTGAAWAQYPHLLQLRMQCALYMEASHKCIGNTCGVAWLQNLANMR